MSIFNSKKALFSSLAVMGIGAVAIGTGLGVSLNNSSSTTLNESSDSKTDQDIKNEITEIDEEKLSAIKSSLDSISLESFTLKTFTNTDVTNRNETYAFDIDPSKLELKINNNNLLIDGYKLEAKIDYLKNKPSQLNDGKLTINIDVVDSNNKKITSDQISSKEIVFSDFKKADSSLTALLKNETASLRLDPTKDDRENSISYNTIETLNSVVKVPKRNMEQEQNEEAEARALELSESSFESFHYLTELLKKQDEYKRGEKMKLIENVSISGEVYLDKITYDLSSNETLFHLVSKEANRPLKLVKKDNSNKVIKQALIGEIITTHLLASDITIKPRIYDANKTQTYKSELVTNSNNLFKNATNKNDLLEKDIYLSLSSIQHQDDLSINKVFIKPYVVDKNNPTSTEIDFCLSISFGDKKFDLDNEYDLQALKLAGFSFNAYTKKLGDDSYTPNMMNFLSANKLDSYFTQSTFTKPVAITNLNTATNGLNETKFENNSLSKSFKITLKDTDDKKTSIHAVFASYSYKEVKDTNVLFTPSLTILKLDKK